MSYNYKDIECPHCGHESRYRFTVESVPFGATTVVGELCHCFKCKGYFKGTVQTVYASRKLSSYEQKKLDKKLQDNPTRIIDEL